MRFAADYSETLEVFLSHSNYIITRQTYSVSTKSTRGFEKLWHANKLSLSKQSNRPKSDTCLYELFLSQRPRKSPPAVMP
jgi:hypothetical protein